MYFFNKLKSNKGLSVISLCLIFGISLTISACDDPSEGKPAIWILTDFTGMKKDGIEFRHQNDKQSQLNTVSDPDDYVAMVMYLMNANKFHTAQIVLGSDGADKSKGTNPLTEFQNRILTAYEHDISFWNSNKNTKGFPSAQEISAVTKLTTLQGQKFDTNENYTDFKSLAPTVKSLVKELEKNKYSAENPLYVLVWGPMTEAAMAVKHLQAKGNTDALERLFVVSHWTTSFLRHNNPSKCTALEEDRVKYGVANCNEDCEACEFLHKEAQNAQAKFRFVDVGSVGQGGIVGGSRPFFGKKGIQGEHAQAFLTSEMGKLFIESNFMYNRPDGSDCATFYTILGDYGLTLNDFYTNGVITEEQERYAETAFKNNANKMMQELLALSQVVQ
ncbi:nucleoside hydrolase-like domain-containing protein [Sediminitomix flava]|uniref:Uncharacterized protein DUF1593 n=1 Tax=Sediminitomix flava TaxID=379075 RepID=A0A315YY09_SEDFL|nr:nucleoside hydrolase-like domain-containing protein [Sediminitomix flava]PWJ35028.1 uncharacterized protein DUF1593 [Sediminitomix flava]